MSPVKSKFRPRPSRRGRSFKKTKIRKPSVNPPEIIDHGHGHFTMVDRIGAWGIGRIEMEVKPCPRCQGKRGGWRVTPIQDGRYQAGLPASCIRCGGSGQERQWPRVIHQLPFRR